MVSFNNIIIIGNVGKDPEIRTKQNGDKFATLSVATSEKWKNEQGERQEKTQWHRVVVFKKNYVTVVEKYVKKGSQILVEGSMEYRDYEDSQGVKRQAAEIVVNDSQDQIKLMDRKKADSPQPE
jgi:single-strand DNA-binding protein